MEKIKKYLWIFILTCTIIELIVFPDYNNLYLCLLALFSLFLYDLVLDQELIRNHFFSFLCYSTLFMYRFLPVFATLLDGNPVSIGFNNALNVFTGELLLFVIATLAFYLNARNKTNNNLLRRFYKKIYIFKQYTSNEIWILGYIGLSIMVISKFTSSIEIQKILQTLSIFRYAPICLLFPKLTGIYYKKRKNVLFYIVFITFISLISGSRQVLLFPICTFLLLFILNCVFFNDAKKLSFNKYIKYLPIFIIIIILFNRISLAMINSRDIVFDKSSTSSDIISSIIYNTFNTENSDIKTKSMFAIDNTYKFDLDEWDEKYVSNSFLNRYCNLRVSDQTLSRAQSIGYNNPDMFSFFVINSYTFLPTPFLHILGINIDKSDYSYSRGDLLYSLSSGKPIFESHVVTSYLGDGLATFGYYYFIIQFILWFFLFKLVDTLILRDNNKVYYSIYGLCSVFMFFGLTRNAQGCSSDYFYIVRLFWNGIIGCIIVCLFLKLRNIVK